MPPIKEVIVKLKLEQMHQTIKPHYSVNQVHGIEEIGGIRVWRATCDVRDTRASLRYILMTETKVRNFLTKREMPLANTRSPRFHRTVALWRFLRSALRLH